MADLKGAIKQPGRIVERYVQLISGQVNLLNNFSFTTPIILDFQPDVMIVQNVMMREAVAAAYPGLYIIQASVTPHNPLIATCAPGMPIAGVNSSFRIERPIRSNFTFTLLDAATLEPPDDVASSALLGITLQFIKYPGKKDDLP